jgi:hypothetical protein
MPEDEAKFQRAIKALLDQYPKQKVLAALQEGALTRPGPKRKPDDEPLLIDMGRLMVWRQNLPVRRAAKIVTRHLEDTKYKQSIIDRLRKKFRENRSHYLRCGKISEIINLVIAKQATAGGSLEQANDRLEVILSGEKVRVRFPDHAALDIILQELRPARPALYYTFPNALDEF